jgi:hypothetical protein
MMEAQAVRDNAPFGCRKLIGCIVEAPGNEVNPAVEPPLRQAIAEA